MTARMIVDVPAADLLTANQRLHRMVAAKRVKRLRTAGQINAREQNVGHYDRAHVTITVAWPDRRRRDVLNIAPTAKALIDGMTAANCWDDDDDAHLIGPDFRVSPTLSGVKGSTRLTFTVRAVELTEEKGA